MAKLVWRVKLVAELEPGLVSETEVARIERDDWAASETVGLTLDEGKRLAAATQAEIVRAQVAVMGERFRCCEHCRAKLASKGYYSATFRSLFGDVAVRARRFCACCCDADAQYTKSFSAWAATGGIAPELAYVTAKFAALAPFARVADLLSELLPIGGAANAGTVRNRSMRVGTTVAKVAPAGSQMPVSGAVTRAVVVGLDGGYVRSRHRRPERNFEVIAGKVIGSDGAQHRFAFARNRASEKEFAGALVRAGVREGTPATVLSDGDAGLRNLQRRVLPEATVVLDWFHIAMRFEHVLQAATGLAARAGEIRRHDIERAKWRLWHGRWEGCLIKLAGIYRRTGAERICDIEGVPSLRHHLGDLLAYLEANQSGLVNYGARHRRGEPISTAFVESAINEITSRRMIKKQQMRWNRWTELEEAVTTWLAQPGPALLHAKVKPMQLVMPPSPLVSPEAVVGMRMAPGNVTPDVLAMARGALRTRLRSALTRAAQGDSRVSGGRTSHAAVVARQLGKVCLVACPGLEIDLERRQCRIGGTLLDEGDMLSLDGNTAAVHSGNLAIVAERPEAALAAIAGWRVAHAP